MYLYCAGYKKIFKKYDDKSLNNEFIHLKHDGNIWNVDILLNSLMQV